MGERGVHTNNSLDLSREMLYNPSEAPTLVEESLFSQHQDGPAELMHEDMITALEKVCDTKDHSTKEKRCFDESRPHGISSRIRKNAWQGKMVSRETSSNGSRFSSGSRSQVAHSGRKTEETKPKHVCKECGKSFKRAHNLKIHGRLHSGDKPYACPFENCSKDFRWKSSIVAHMNWHGSKKGELLPGQMAHMYSLIKKKPAKPQTENKATIPGCYGEDQELEGATKQEGREARFGYSMHGGGPQDYYGGQAPMARAETGHRREMGAFEGDLSSLRGNYGAGIEGGTARRIREDTSVLTRGATTFHGPSAGVEMGELDCLPLLDEKEWEPRGMPARPGMGQAMLPSLSCCRIDTETDGFSSFLEDN